MTDAVPQNFSNHRRLDPPFHFFILPVFAITLIATIIHLVRRPGPHSAWLVVFIVAAIVALFKIRLYTLKVQDRVIRLEERLRLASLLDAALRPRIAEFTEAQFNRSALRVRCRTSRARRPRPERETLRPRDQESSPALASRLLESVNSHRGGSCGDGRPRSLRSCWGRCGIFPKVSASPR